MSRANIRKVNESCVKFYLYCILISDVRYRFVKWRRNISSKYLFILLRRTFRQRHDVRGATSGKSFI